MTTINNTNIYNLSEAAIIVNANGKGQFKKLLDRCGLDPIMIDDELYVNDIIIDKLKNHLEYFKKKSKIRQFENNRTKYWR